MSKGRLIIFEGGEGSGKGTQIEKLVSWYAPRFGRDMFVVTFEPGGGDPNYRKVIMALDKADPHFAERELELFEADRSVHYRDTIIPALREGRIVFCDRSWLSTIAYQGYGRGVDFALIESANQKATWGCTPDLTVIIDIDPRVGIARKYSSQPECLNRFELEGYDFHDRVRAGYLAEARKSPERFFVVDGHLGQDEISRQIMEELHRRFGW